MKKELCKNCAYYNAFYKQWSDGYGKLNIGYCSKIEEQRKQFDICEAFKSNEQKEEKKAVRRLKLLEQALISINEIAQILKEKESENKKENSR